LTRARYLRTTPPSEQWRRRDILKHTDEHSASYKDHLNVSHPRFGAFGLPPYIHAARMLEPRPFSMRRMSPPNGMWRYEHDRRYYSGTLLSIMPSKSVSKVRSSVCSPVTCRQFQGESCPYSRLPPAFTAHGGAIKAQRVCLSLRARAGLYLKFSPLDLFLLFNHSTHITPSTRRPQQIQNL
jgi:hypothetical protein